MTAIDDIREGCYVDGRDGQYAGEQVVRLCDELCGTNLLEEWPVDPRDGSLLGTYGATGDVWAGINGDEDVELMVSLMDRAECLLNDHYATETHAFMWLDGDFGYYSFEEMEEWG